MTVASQSIGLTPLANVTGSEADAGDNSASDQFRDNQFQEGSDGNAISAAGFWTEGSHTYDWGTGWEKDGSGERAATRALLPATTIPAGDTNTREASFEKQVPVALGTVGITAFIKGEGWRFYGDDVKQTSFMTMTVLGSTNNGSSYPSTLFTRRINFTARKLTAVSFKRRNTSFNKLKVIFKAQATSKHATRQISTGKFVVEDVKFVGVTGTVGTAELPRSKPLVELTQDGLFLFSDKNSSCSPLKSLYLAKKLFCL